MTVILPIRRLMLVVMLAVIIALPLALMWLLRSSLREHFVGGAILEARSPSFWWPAAWRSEHRVRSKLKDPVTIEFGATRLNHVVQLFEDYMELRIRWDDSVLAAQGVEPATSVTVRVRELQLGSILRILLREFDAGYVIRDGELVITTHAEGMSEEERLVEQSMADSAAEERIEWKLAQPISLDFQAAPLADVIGYIRDAKSINFVFDRQRLWGGADADSPVTVDVEDVPLGEALGAMLRDLRLIYKVQDGVVQITADPRPGSGAAVPQ